MKSDITYNTRAIALDVLTKVGRGDILDHAMHDMDKDYTLSTLDRSFLNELLYGTLRWRGRIDHMIEVTSDRAVKRIDGTVLNILRLGVYQLAFMDRVPPFAAVDECVKLTGKRGKGFVNGVLRSIARNGDGLKFPSPDSDAIRHIEVVYSHPRWMIEKFLEMMELKDVICLCKANNEIPLFTIRTNTLKVDRDRLKKSLEDEGFKSRPTERSPDGLVVINSNNITESHAYKEGLFYIQDEAAQLVSRLLEPRPGDKILDACAAPGGKATHLAQLIGNSGEILAVDINPGRLEYLKENCLRLGIKCARCLEGNIFHREFSNEEPFDRIMLDVPCSNSGVLRRRPDGKWRVKVEDLGRLTKLQLRLLKAVSKFLKRGGTIVYTTCSLFEDENEGVVDEFLSGQDDFVQEKVFRTYRHKGDMDGFFAVKLKKL